MRFRDLFESIPSMSMMIPPEVEQKVVAWVKHEIDMGNEEMILMEYRMAHGRDPYDMDRSDTEKPGFDEWLHDWVADKAYDVLYSIRQRLQGDKLPVFRVITADANWTPDGRHPGIYWSWDKRAADAHWGDFSGAHLVWMIEGAITWDAIEWVNTLAKNVCQSSSEEKEIRLIDNAPVEILRYYQH